MPRAKKPRENFLDTDLTRPTADAEPVRIDAADDELEAVFSDFPQHDQCIELFRTTEKGGHPAFLEDIAPADFSFGYVCSTYGGGRYIAKGKYKDGRVVKRNFDIEGDPFPVKRKIPASPLTVVTPAPERATERVEVIRNENGQPDMAATMLSLMKTMVSELKTSEVDMLNKMRMYKELFGGGEKPQQPLDQALNMFQKGVELASMNQGDGGGGNLWMMALRELKEPLTDIVATIKHAVTNRQPAPGLPMPGAPATSPVAGAGGPATPPSSGPQPTGESRDMEFMLMAALKQMLPMLVTGAAQGAAQGQTPEESAGFYCDFLLDQIPVKYYDTARTLLEKPDCLDRLAGLNPGVRAYRPWFEQLQGELYRAILERLGHATGSVQSEPSSDPSTNGSADI